ncbi:Uncharacterised protein [Mycobacteroides abscessus]|nr:Uncharacterised protein [Mycobacteroides abscessus]
MSRDASAAMTFVRPGEAPHPTKIGTPAFLACPSSSIAARVLASSSSRSRYGTFFSMHAAITGSAVRTYGPAPNTTRAAPAITSCSASTSNRSNVPIVAEPAGSFATSARSASGRMS